MFQTGAQQIVVRVIETQDMRDAGVRGEQMIQIEVRDLKKGDGTGDLTIQTGAEEETLDVKSTEDHTTQMVVLPSKGADGVTVHTSRREANIEETKGKREG